MKRPTIADVARRAGVSKGAVSYALNGQPGVSEATRQRILAIADGDRLQPEQRRPRPLRRHRRGGRPGPVPTGPDTRASSRSSWS